MINLCASILEFICLYIASKSFFQLSLIPKLKDIFAGILISFMSILIPASYPVANMLVGQLLYFIYVFAHKKDSMLNRTIVYCLSYIITLISQFIVIILLSLTHITITDSIMPIFGNTLTLLLLCFLFFILHAQRLYVLIAKAALPYRLLLVNCYFVLTSILLYFKADIHNFYNNVAYLAIILVLIVCANVCVLYYDQKLFLKQQEVLSYQKNLPIYQALIDEIRTTQHEYANRIQMFHNLPLICKDYDSICKALQTNTANYVATTKAYPLLQLNMPLVAASLYNLYSQAEKQNINIIFDVGTTTLNSNAPEYQLADYICILTQNAIEACKPGDRIYVHLTSQDGIVHYEIRNPIERIHSHEETARFFQKHYSTKQSTSQTNGTKRGLGLYHLATSLESYNGYVGVDCSACNNQNWIYFTLDV